MTSNNIKPIIIIGMHRSGTTLITDFLREAGIFMGADLEVNSESKIFVKLNESILKGVQGSWSNPGQMGLMLGNETIFNNTVDYLNYVVHSIAILRYTGVKRYFSLGCKNAIWGWKDPRNSYTLPLWKMIYPDAKIIHVYRNGIDVANSLRRRTKYELNSKTDAHKTRRRLGIYSIIQKKSGYCDAVRALSLEGAFSLWEEYVGTCLSYEDCYSGDMAHIKYEDFLENPRIIGDELLGFVQIKNNDKAKTFLKKINKDRGYAFLGNKELTEFYNKVSGAGLMKRLGYDKI